MISSILGGSGSAKKLKSANCVILIATLLIGAWLRFDALTRDLRFHPDEALFATFARDAAVHGQWMFPGAMDKPPLSLYAAALSMHSVGVHLNDKGVLDLDVRIGEFAARLPATLAGIVAVSLTYILAFTLSRQRVAALIAALLIALSPYHIAFSATAFTDPLMLTCGLASLVLAARNRPAWAGVWLALSVWGKQQGIFFLPLVLWMLSRNEIGRGKNNLAASRLYDSNVPSPPPNLPRKRRRDQLPSQKFSASGHWRSDFPLSSARRAVGRGLGGGVRSLWIIVCLAIFLIGVGLLLAWDAARASNQNATSLFALAAANNNPERAFIRPDELLPRLAVWGSYLGRFFGSPLVTWGLIFVGALGVTLTRQMWRRLAPLAGFCIVYLLAHWWIAFNLYDRYLLPLVPLLVVIVGVGMAGWLSRIRHFNGRDSGHCTAVSLQILLMGFVAGVVLFSAYPARYPTDSRARDDDIIQLAAHLNAKPLGAILYDPWLGWELGYYLGAWSDKRRVHYPAPDILADDALLNPDRAPRYFIAPRAQDIAAWLVELENNGFKVTLDWENIRYVVFEVLPPETVGSQSAR